LNPSLRLQTLEEDATKRLCICYTRARGTDTGAARDIRFATRISKSVGDD
jgi:hypothetical protein